MRDAGRTERTSELESHRSSESFPTSPRRSITRSPVKPEAATAWCRVGVRVQRLGLRIQLCGAVVVVGWCCVFLGVGLTATECAALARFSGCIPPISCVDTRGAGARSSKAVHMSQQDNATRWSNGRTLCAIFKGGGAKVGIGVSVNERRNEVRGTTPA